MNSTTRFRKLLEPGRIGVLELKNRIVMPPMGSRLCSVLGEATDALIEWYATRARGGAGLIIVENTHVAPTLEPLRTAARQLRLDNDAFGATMAQVVEAVHEAGAKIGIELSPGGGAQAHADSMDLGLSHMGKLAPVAPSPVASPVTKRLPRELTVKEIENFVEMCGSGAARAKRLGFDLVDIHAHGGYLIGEFMSPYFNKRTDMYGGSLDNRLRFLLEIVGAMRKNLGRDFALTVKYSVDEFIEGGLDLREGLIVAQRLEQAGVNAIEISCGIYGAKQPATAPMYYPEGYLVPLAQAVKGVVGIPIIVSGRLGDPDRAELVLREAKADFIGMGRALIADPDLPRKVAEGRLREIRRCIACNACRNLVFKTGSQIRCALNAAAGRELRYGLIKPAEKAKTVAVVGAGPAGMEAARIAALRGHSVTLYEKADELGGGQLRLAATPPHKEVLKNIVDYYSVVLKQLDNVKIHLGREVTAEEIAREHPDVAIVATGGAPVIPDIPGVDNSIVVTAFDVLAGKASVGGTVIVAGGGAVGCETANWLAKQNKKVTVVEMLDVAGADAEAWSWRALEAELSQRDVKIMTGTKIDALTDEGALLTDKTGRKLVLKADTVVLALGTKPQNKMMKEMTGKTQELYAIGDAREARQIRNAISDGYIAACSL